MRHLFTSLSFIWVLGAVAQDLELQWEDNNGTTITLGSNHISGDFGRREFGGNKWHDGLDVTGAPGDTDHGYKIKSIEAGRIRRIEGSGFYHWIAIEGAHNFGYGHIFRWNSDSEGNFRLIEWQGRNTYVIIDIGSTIALTSIDLPAPNTTGSENYVINYQENETTYTFSLDDDEIINYVEAGDIIAPMGDSGGTQVVNNQTVADDDFDVHIHLYNFVSLPNSASASQIRRWSNLKDPIQYLDHEEPTYRPSIAQVKRDGNFYTNPSFRVRVDMTHEFTTADWQGGTNNGEYNAGEPIADLNAAILWIRKSTQSDQEYFPIEGAYFESYISDGSGPLGLFSDRYPAHGNPLNNVTGGDAGGGTNNLDWPSISGVDIAHTKTSGGLNSGTSAGFGDYRKTGIVGQAYTGSIWNWVRNNYDPDPTPGPWDDYFFNDFPSRIHKDDNFGRDNALMASEISEARYPDGLYYLKVEAQNVDGDYFEDDLHAPTQLIIDNFKPYIKSVTIRNSGGTVIYKGEWSWNSTTSELSIARNLMDFDNGSSLTVEVTTSEPMLVLPPPALNSGLSLRVDVLGTFTASEVSKDNMTFTFDLPALPPTEQNQNQTLYFSGYDLNNNQLDTDPSTIAIRTNETTWGGGSANPGEDYNFTLNAGDDYCSQGGFRANGGSGKGIAGIGASNATAIVTGGCSYLDIESSTLNPQVGEAVTFKAITDPYTNLSWSFGSTAIPQTSNEEEVTVVFTGSTSQTVTVTLTVDGNSVTHDIYVGANSVPVSIDGVTINGNVTAGGNVGEVFSLMANVSNVTGQIAYQWDFGSGANYSNPWESNPTVTYYTPGSKNVRLTIYDDVSSSTRTFNSKINIYNYPVLQTSISGCESNPYGGYVQFDHFTSGGDGVNWNRTFYWDFGDGQYSIEESPNHQYLLPGHYSVSLTVCDNSGCIQETSEDCVVIPENGPNASSWHVLLYGNGSDLPNDLLCPTDIVIPTFSVGSPITFNVDVQRGGGGFDENYDYDWDFSSTAGCTWSPPQGASPDDAYSQGEHCENQPPETRLYPIGPRNHTVTYNYPGYYVVRVGITGCYGSTVKYGTIKIIDNGIGSPRCKVGFGSVSISNTCYDPLDLPELDYQIQFNNCPVDQVDLYQKIDGVFILAVSDVQTGDELDFTWTATGEPLDANEFKLVARNGLNESGTNTFSISFDKDPNISLEESYSLCLGASSSIGVPSESGFSYEWSGTNLAYLSSAHVANPVFTGLANGNYDYTLNVTNLQSGCTYEQGTASIVVGNTIGSDNYTQNLSVTNGAVTLKAPFEGDGRSYDYTWDPSTYLDNPNVPNPVFNTPLSGENITYNVTATFRQCTATGQATVIVENYPPSDLIVDNSALGVLKLSWTDNSVESKFVIERSENGGSWESIDEVGSDITKYTDAYCLDPSELYYYRVAAYDLNHSLIGYTGVISGRVNYQLYERWEQEVVDMDLRNPVGKFHDYSESEALFIGSEGYNTSAFYTNLAAFKVDKETGITTKWLSSNQFTGSQWVRYASSCESPNGYLTINQINNTDSRKAFAIDLDGPNYLTALQTTFPSVAGLVNQKLISSGNKTYVLGSTIHMNNLNTQQPEECDRNRYNSVVMQVIDYNSESYSFGTPLLISNVNDYYKDIFQDAVMLSSSEMVAVSISELGPWDYCENNNWMNPGEDEDLIRVQRINTESLQVTSEWEIENVNGGFNSIKLHRAGDVSLTLVGNSYEGTPTNQSGRKIWMRNYLTILGGFSPQWEVEFDYNNQDLFLDLIIGRSGAPVVISHTETLQDNLHIYEFDLSGEIEWEYHATFDWAANIQDAFFYDNANLMLAAVNPASNSGGVILKKFSLLEDLSQPIQVCEDVLANESLSKVASAINVAEGTCEVNFESGSSTSLAATTAITLKEGTWIKEGAYFSAVAMDEILVGDCSAFGLPSGRLAAVLDEDFTEEHLTENVFLIYPNPSTRYFQIDLQFTAEAEISLALFDTQGRVVWHDSSYGSSYFNDVSAENFGSGLYLLQVRTSNGLSKTLKVLISK